MLQTDIINALFPRRRQLLRVGHASPFAASVHV